YIVVAMGVGTLLSALFTGLAALFPKVPLFTIVAKALGKLPVIDTHGLTLGRARASTMAKGGAAVMLLGALALGGTSGCSLAQDIAKSPAVYVGDFELALNVANDGAKALFAVIVQRLAPSQQASAQAAFDRAESSEADAVSAINDALAAYQDGKAQDWAKLIADAQDALARVVAAVDVWADPKTGAALGGVGPTLDSSYVAHRAALHDQIASLSRYH
ncbi:MAG TPA: hypothetical protein VGI39_01535, partial [Polyangiaceae bacterium]